jgi:hypothetical protein
VGRVPFSEEYSDFISQLEQCIDKDPTFLTYTEAFLTFRNIMMAYSTWVELSRRKFEDSPEDPHKLALFYGNGHGKIEDEFLRGPEDLTKVVQEYVDLYVFQSIPNVVGASKDRNSALLTLQRIAAGFVQLGYINRDRDSEKEYTTDAIPYPSAHTLLVDSLSKAIAEYDSKPSVYEVDKMFLEELKVAVLDISLRDQYLLWESAEMARTHGVTSDGSSITREASKYAPEPVSCTALDVATYTPPLNDVERYEDGTDVVPQHILRGSPRGGIYAGSIKTYKGEVCPLVCRIDNKSVADVAGNITSHKEVSLVTILPDGREAIMSRTNYVSQDAPPDELSNAYIQLTSYKHSTLPKNAIPTHRDGYPVDVFAPDKSTRYVEDMVKDLVDSSIPPIDYILETPQ